MERFEVHPVGWIQSTITDATNAPLQGDEGGVDAWIQFEGGVLDAIHGVRPGSELIVLTWLHQADRNVLRVHPRGNPTIPLTGVFATRSPDRPNPIGLHVVTVKECRENSLLVGPIEAINGTPVIDLKPVI